MNLNQLSRELAKREGLRKQVNIAQIKELLRCLRDMLREKPLTVMSALLRGLK